MKQKLNRHEYNFSKAKSLSVPFLYFISPPVNYQAQVDFIYYDFSSTFHLVSRTDLLHRLSAYGLFEIILFWQLPFLSAIFCRHFRQILVTFEVLCGPTVICIGRSIFSVLITELCSNIQHCKYLLFADEVKTFHAINSAYDCILRQSGTEPIRLCCTSSHYININNTNHTLIVSI
jgi:hypothetical protein